MFSGGTKFYSSGLDLSKLEVRSVRRTDLIQSFLELVGYLPEMKTRKIMICRASSLGKLVKRPDNSVFVVELCLGVLDGTQVTVL